MLKRNFDETQLTSYDPPRGDEPQAKRPYFSNIASQHENNHEIPSPNVLDYFDKKLEANSGGSNQQNIGVFKPVIIDLDADDPEHSKSSTDPNETLSQVPANSEATGPLNSDMVRNPPSDIPISDQKLRCYSGPKAPKYRNTSESKKMLLRIRAEEERAQFIESSLMKPECCVVEKLIKRFYYLNEVTPLTENELNRYIKSGRPTPAIPSLRVNETLYNYHLWLTGCPTLKKLYCWICLLFTSGVFKGHNTVWVKEGYSTMDILGTSMSKHVKTFAHLDAMSIKNQVMEKTVVPNRTQGANFGQGSNDTKAVHSQPATKLISTSSNRSTNLQNFSNEDVMKPSSFDSRTASNPKNPGQTPDSSTGLNVAHNDLDESNPVVATENKIRETLRAVQQQTPQAKVCDLGQFEYCERSSSETMESSTPKDSFEEHFPRYTHISQYRKWKKEQQAKKLSQLSVKTQKQPPQTPPPPPPPPAGTPLSTTDLATIQTVYFPNGRFNGSEELRDYVISVGRPTPEMPGLAQEIDGAVKYFDLSYYDEFPWMCGCAEINRLYCWPCMMFNDHNHNSTWNTVGHNSMANLSSAASSHSIQQSHLELSIRLKMIEQRIKNKGQNSKTDRAEHNKKVRQKRSLMKYLIDAVCFKKKLLNNADICHEDFNGFLKILSTYDMKLKAFLDPGSANYMADFTPNFISNYSNETIKALETILQRKIAEEVEQSLYVSFILKTAKHNHVALILRYTKTTSEVIERFYKFIEIGFGLREDLLKQIVAEVHELKCPAKFVGISYDGGVLHPDQMESFNSDLVNEFKGAYFFHNRDDNFQAILQQSLSRTPFCRAFFQLVTEFGNFLQDNPRVKNLIRRFEYKTSGEKPQDWDLKSGIIITIRDHYSTIMKFLDQVVNGTSLSPHMWTNQIVLQCSKFSMFLGLIETRLFLVLFSRIYVSLLPLIEAFQGEFDAKHWKTVSTEARTAVLSMRAHSFRDMYKSAENLGGVGVDGQSRSAPTRLLTIFNETIDWILAFMTHRTKYIDVWSYFDFSTDKLDGPVAKAYQNMGKFQTALNEYFPYLYCHKLGSALIFAQYNEHFRNKSAAEILRIVKEFDFKTILPELYSYLLLIQTVPQSSANVTSPVSGKITLYVQGKTHLKSADALLHLEKDLLSSARNEPTFYDDVLKIISELKCTNEFTEIDQSD